MPEREYASLKILHGEGILVLDGLKLKKVEGEIQPGDLYIGERNQGPKLLTCKEVRKNEHFPHNSMNPGFVIATTMDYSYDLDECVKVEEVKEA